VKFRHLRYLNLLVVIIVMMIVSPFVSRSPYLRMFNNVVLSLVLLAVVYTVKKQRRTFILGLCLGIPWVLLAWVHLFDQRALHPAVLALSSMVFDGYVIFVLLRHIIRSRKVTADILYGAVSVYILLGVFFTSLYLFLDALIQAPLFEYVGSGASTIYAESSRIFYFSFVTLTTLGYGDIRPISDITRTFAVIEAMTGVLYSAALIGRLIGMYVAQSRGSVDAAEAASMAATAAAAAADAAATDDKTVAAAAAETASQAAADAVVAAEAAKADTGGDGEDDGEDDNGDDDTRNDEASRDPDTNR